MSSFCNLIIISFKYILKCVGEKRQPWHTSLVIFATFENAVLNNNLCLATELFRQGILLSETL